MSVEVLEVLRCHTGPFRDLTDGISKSGSTSTEYQVPVCVPPEHFKPDAASHFGLASSETYGASCGPCHPGVFPLRLRLQNFELVGRQTFQTTVLPLHGLERTNSQRSLWRPLICLIMT